MDAFFASVEQRDFPELRGKPIVVGHDGPRSVVATASYEARPFGVHSAQPIATAKRLCPNLIIVPGRYHVYKEVSAQMHAIFHEYTDLIEPISLDEAFLDVTQNKTGQTMAVEIAREIKQKIRERLQLTASAGVSYCKFLAKIASDLRKPDGLSTIHPSRAQQFIDNLGIEKFWGVGPRTAEALHQYGIFKGSDLRQKSLPYLIERFGKMGGILYNFARGIDLRPVEPTRERKSVGCEQTFETDLTEPDQLRDALSRLATELARRLLRTQFRGGTLTLKVKFANFQQITRSLTLPEPVEPEAERILELALIILQDPTTTAQPIRLLGLSVSHSAHDEADDGTKGTSFTQLEFEFLPWEDEIMEGSQV
ncbi:MAG: DNA polymerase IV [Bacteroidaceae bacterium]|nr:DNA polymerase IV [Bacteroidaceae bacterium]